MSDNNDSYYQLQDQIRLADLQIPKQKIMSLSEPLIESVATPVHLVAVM